MMWQEWAFYWLSPLTLAMELWLAAIVCLWTGRRRWALALSIIGFAGLWVGAMPAMARVMAHELEGRYPSLPAAAAPSADAIVVLGGALATAQPPERPTFVLGPSATRIWYAADLYRAGKARWVVVAAGNRPAQAHMQVEADAIAEMLERLGVPESAIRRETLSQTTRENARNVRPLLEALGVHRVLLVTSAQHMPRAMETFVTVWGPSSMELIPAATDVRIVPDAANGPEVWFPSLDALLVVTKCLKEFAGMVALAIIE